MAKKPNVERAADLLLRAQLAGTRGEGVSLGEVRDSWNQDAKPGEEVTAATMRSVLRHLLKVAAEDGFESLGTLSRRRAPDEAGKLGRPARGMLFWKPARQTKTRGVPKVENLDLERVFMGELACAPLEKAAKGVFADVFGPLEFSLDDDEKDRMKSLRMQGYYYQPAARRQLDPQIAKECIRAVIFRNVLQIDEYRSPNKGYGARSYTFEPWTLVQSHDGLYVLGRRSGASEGSLFVLAVHRMVVARRLLDQHFQVPNNHRPSKFFGHGFGPFVGKPGTTRLFVSDEEWNHVEEMVIPSCRERERVDGGWELELDTGFTHGLRLWCRWMGIRILESTGMKESDRELQRCPPFPGGSLCPGRP